jgi:hypothetical protein
MFGALYRCGRRIGELRHHDGISPAWPISYDELGLLRGAGADVSRARVARPGSD